MMARKGWPLALALMGGAAAMLLWTGVIPGFAPDTAPSGSLEETAQEGWAYAQQPGMRQVYDLNFEGEIVQPDGDTAMIKIEGDMWLSDVRTDKDGTWVALNLPNPKVASVKSNNRDALTDPKLTEQIFERSTLFFHRTPSGEILARSASKTTDPLFAQLALFLVGELKVVLDEESMRAGKPWQAEHDGSLGFGASQFQYSAEEQSIVRERSGYGSIISMPTYTGTEEADIHSRFEARLHPAGYLTSLQGEERLKVAAEGQTDPLSAKVALDLQWKRSESFNVDALRTAQREANHLQDLRDAGAVARQASLLDRIEDLTPADLLHTLQTLPENGKVSGTHRKWIWQAVGLLHLYPEEAESVAKLVADKSQPRQTHALATDLLANASTPESREALRNALASPDVQAYPHAGDLFQRMALLKRTDRKTAAFLQESLHSKSPQIIAGAGVALGTTARLLAKVGDEKTALGSRTALLGALKGAKTPQVKRGLAAGLGNTHHKEVASALIQTSKDADPTVRRTVVRALRRLDSNIASERMWEMTSDPTPMVRNGAVDSLVMVGIAPGNGDRVLNIIQQEQTGTEAMTSLLIAAKEWVETSPEEAAQIIKAVEAKGAHRDVALHKQLETTRNALVAHGHGGLL